MSTDVAQENRPVIVFDTEVYPNFFLFKGRVLHNRNLITINSDDEYEARQKLRETLRAPCTFVSFNGINFDMPIISAFLAGHSTEEITKIANYIIKEKKKPWDAEKRFGFRCISMDHIDLIEVVPGFVGLKSYGARMHMPWLKDLPYPPGTYLNESQKVEIDRYCENDLDITEELFKRLEPQLKLRIAMSHEYGVDMRSKSDAQMAETAFVTRLNMSTGKKRAPTVVKFKAPPYIQFKNPELQKLAGMMQEHDYFVNPETGHVMLPVFLDNEIVKLGQGTYQMGIGGLHSTHDKKVCHVASGNWDVCDIDAASYYPSIWVKWGNKLEKTDKRLTEEYVRIYERRLTAKSTGNKELAENLKIPLNGSFGKLTSIYSPLYNPELGLFITLTGQLTLLQLIEELEENGATALSANTDGIAIGYPTKLRTTVESVVHGFSLRSQYLFEYTPYRVLAMKDVNNYIAVKADRSVKAKGIYAYPGLQKNPTASVCVKAVAVWLGNGTPFEATIREAPFVDFISARSVSDGGVQDEEYLGEVVRWYQTTDTTLPPLTYKKNGNKVPKTEGARACMLIEDKIAHPSDLNYDYYVKEAIRIAADIGCSDYLTENEIALITPPPKVRKTRKAKS